MEGLVSNRSLSPRTQQWKCLKHPLSSSSPWRRLDILFFHPCLLWAQPSGQNWLIGPGSLPTHLGNVLFDSPGIGRIPKAFKLAPGAGKPQRLPHPTSYLVEGETGACLGSRSVAGGAGRGIQDLLWDGPVVWFWSNISA